MPTYHDLHITTAEIPRTSIFNLPYGYEVSCTRTAGWHLRKWEEENQGEIGTLIAGEYENPEEWLVLDIAGHVIVDSREREPVDAS